MAVILFCGLTNARAMEGEAMQEAVLQRMASMSEAATRAAIAAEEALKRATSSSSGGTNPHEGLSAASRILKTPDTFNGEDLMLFQQWKHQFTSWLCFGDNWYAEALDLLEKTDTAPAWSSYNEDERLMSQKLYAVLTSYLRGKCAHVVRAESKVKDGFKLWFNLNHEFMPSTRQRSLALAQALGSYPSFRKDRSSLESILNYEQLVLEYEQASGSVYPKELMAATSTKCCQPWLREQIQLSITDTTSYVDIREKIISYERASRAWTSDHVLKHVTEPYPSGSADGPSPMEVDRVESRGKGKNKGKNKGRGSGAEWAGMLYGRGRGRGRSNKGKKVRAKQKGSQRASRVATKVGPRVARKAQVVVRWHMNSAQTAWSTGTGAGNAPTWQSIRYPTNKR